MVSRDKRSDSMYTALITFELQKGHRQAFIDACSENGKKSIHEPGCYQFDLLEHHSDPDVFFLFEIYDNETSFKQHVQTPHFFHWRDTVTPWFAKPPKYLFMNTVLPTAAVRRHVKEAFMKGAHLA